jgi:hypothetical protein
LLVLYLKHGTSIQHQPPNVQEQRPDDRELRRVQLVTFVQILVVQLNQLHALILLESGELLELLSEQVAPKLHWCFLVKVIEVLQIFGLLPDPVLKIEVFDLVGQCRSRHRGGVVTFGSCLVDIEILLPFLSDVELLVDEPLPLVCRLDELVNSRLVEYPAPWAQQRSANEPAHSSEHMDIPSPCRIVEAQVV